MSSITCKKSVLATGRSKCLKQAFRGYVDLDLWDTLGAPHSLPSSKNLPIKSADFVTCKYVKGKFISPWPQVEKGLAALLKWQTSRQKSIVFPSMKGAKSHTCIKSLPVKQSRLFVTDKPHVTWIGHATCYFQLEGLYFITDPIFSNTCSPIEYLGNYHYQSVSSSIVRTEDDQILSDLI